MGKLSAIGVIFVILGMIAQVYNIDFKIVATLVLLGVGFFGAERVL